MRKLLLIPFILVLASCEKLLIEEPDYSNLATFDYLWETIDHEYSLFDVKNVDWQAIRSQYRQMADSSSNDIELFETLADMLNLLDDGHVNLISTFDVSRSEETFLRFYGRQNIDIPTVALNYLGSDYHSTGGMAYNTLRDGKVLYIRYSSFNNNISPSQLRFIIKRYPNTKGLILDMRQNGGGYINNIWNILNVMPGQGQLLYRTQIKSGPGHGDFAPVEAVTAPEVDNPYTGKVVLLIDRGSYSATSFFALCCRSYDNITLVGDTTGGGLGLPKGRQLPNGWYVRYSVTRTLAPDGTNFENGVPPDEVVVLDPLSTAAGKDNVIERACDIIEN